MTPVKDVMLPIRLPAELKDMFQTLCKTRGVSVSSELRRLMAQEVSHAAMGISSPNRQKQAKNITQANPAKKTPIKKNIEPTVVENRKPSRCNDTDDMFDCVPAKPSQAPDSSGSFLIEMLNKEPESHLGLSSPVSANNRINKKRKKAKNSKK